MAVTPFAWFVLTLFVTISNIILSAVVYAFLSAHKKPTKDLRTLKQIALFYAAGMTIALIAALALLSTTPF